jgi:hypothetical protein
MSDIFIFSDTSIKENYNPGISLSSGDSGQDIALIVLFGGI